MKKFRRWLWIVIAVCLLFHTIFFTSCVEIEEQVVEFNYSVNEDKISCTITGIKSFSGNNHNILFPKSINGYTVTSIGSRAFENSMLGIEGITIPDSVTTIGVAAFKNCYVLQSVTISNSVTSIDEYAFMGCYSLDRIVVDQNNPIYHSSGNCLIETASKTLIAGSSSSNIPADGSVTSIGVVAFGGRGQLSKIIIPDSVTNIAMRAFEKCNLSTILLPNSVTSIGRGAFSFCNNLNFVYYTGTIDEWEAINIESDNNELTYAIRYYYSETQPTTEGNYWHYVGGVPTKW